jgi:DNA-binding transcriptional LysR family regulator
MNLRELKIFVTVCESKSMSAAATKLYITQPAISQTISELENKLNVKLFERIKRRLKLTYSGKVLLKYSKRILNLVDETQNTIEDIVNMNQGQLRIGASTTIGTYLLPQIMSKFQQKHKEIDLPFIIDNTSIIEKMILNNTIDLGLVEGPVHSEDIFIEHFFDDQLYLMCSTRHKWSDWKTINPVKLKEANLIMREKGSGTRKIIENIITKFDISYQITHTFNNIESIKKAIEANLGVSILPEISVKKEMIKGKITKLNLSGIEFKRKFSIIYHRDKYHSKIFKKFIKHLYKS